jgi:prepilin-type N-terminal cleavage/methylation domain-containing protein
MKKAFTLLEILLVIGIIALLAAALIIAINPGRQFAKTRNTQRWSDVNAILSAVIQNMSDNKGKFNCAAGDIPATPTEMASTGGYNIAPCLVPTYLPSMPYDPSTGYYNSSTDYNSKYTISKSADGRITVSAPDAELGETISTTR